MAAESAQQRIAAPRKGKDCLGKNTISSPSSERHSCPVQAHCFESVHQEHLAHNGTTNDIDKSTDRQSGCGFSSSILKTFMINCPTVAL